jgi:hypothetical protein
LPSFNRVQIVHIIVGAGIAVIGLSLFWLVLTLPVSAIIEKFTEQGVLSSDAQPTIDYLHLMIGAFGLIAGLSIMVWGFVKSVEEREYGFYTP